MGKSEGEKSRSVVETRSVRGADAPQTSLINILVGPPAVLLGEACSDCLQVVSTACLGGFVYGFAANALSGSLSQPTFIAKFLTTPDVTSRQDGMLAG